MKYLLLIAGVIILAGCSETDNRVSVGEGGEFVQTVVEGVDDGGVVTIDQSESTDNSVSTPPVVE